ncbi:MAG: 3'-5' exonuclease, partial [Candidatus Acidiferrales bacterium]
RERAAPLWEALDVSPNEKLKKFRALIVSLQEELGRKPLPEVLEFALRETGYERWLAEQNTPEAEGRLENLHELIAAARESAERGETLTEFLDRAALVSDSDDYDAAAPITLMTLHSAKGTEFDLVFLVGMEEGLFPHSRSLDSEAEIEEERRLCYVGLTRAKNDLYLTRALARRSWAGTEAETNEPSRFLEEIPEELLERDTSEKTPAAAAPGEWRYEPVESAGSQARRSGRASWPRRRRSEDDLTPRPPRRRRDPDYPTGCEVRHATFGAGTVVAVDGAGTDKKIVVQFTGYGRKTLMERYAGLERV